MTCNRLRIDPNDGSSVVEYRVENDGVERRTLDKSSGCMIEGEWQQLTRDQLASHVMANTVVAHWLSKRLGLHALLRACTRPHSSSLSNEMRRDTRHTIGEFSPLFAEGETSS